MSSQEPDRPRRSPWSRRLLIGLGVALLPEIFGNTVADFIDSMPPVMWVKAHSVYAFIVVLGLVGVTYLLLYLRDRLQHRQERLPPPVEKPRQPQPEPQELPRWHEFPVRLRGRESEIDRALRALRHKGMVAITGARDIGTSSVANAVIDRLRDDGVITGPDAVVWIDLRGRSATQPPKAMSVAAHVLSTFNLDEPADSTPAVLADAAARLLAAMRERATVLLLDNVFHADQVGWLTNEWPLGGGLPHLVIAGAGPVADGVPRDVVVHLDELGMHVMRHILNDQLDEPWHQRAVETVRAFGRDLRGDRTDRTDDMLRTFGGRPRAVAEIARLSRLSGGRRWLEDALIDAAGDAGEPLVALWRVVLPRLMTDTLTSRARELMRAMAVLPVTGLGRDALDALIPPDGGYTDAVDELRRAHIVQESPHGRFRLPEEVRLAVRRNQPGPVPDELWDAVARLVSHYAAQASQWAAALGSVVDAASGNMWLHQEEPLLRALITDWRPDTRPPTSLVDDFAAIADALDIWYVRELQSDGLVQTSYGLGKLADEAGRADLTALADLRTSAAHRIGTHLDLATGAIGAEPDGRSFALRARWHHERGLIEFDEAARLSGDRPASNERLNAAEQELREALALVPAPDLSGRMCVLINLAAVAIEQGRSSSAQDLLAQAETLAEQADDLSGRAQVVELRGVVAIRGGSPVHAVALWQEALAWYRDLGEEQGLARCLQHLGGLAVVSPDIAGLLDTGQPSPIGPDRAARVAYDYLSQSKHLLAGQPSSEIVDYYLEIVSRRLG